MSEEENILYSYRPNVDGTKSKNDDNNNNDEDSLIKKYQSQNQKVFQHKFDMNFFKQLFDESLEDFKRLRCLNRTQTYTGKEVESMLSFFKIPFLSHLKMNEDRLLSLLSDSVVDSRLIENNKRPTIATPQETNQEEITLDDLDVDDILAQNEDYNTGFCIDDNSSTQSSKSEHKKEKALNTNLHSKEFDDNEDNEYHELLNKAIHIPDLDKELSKLHNDGDENSMENSCFEKYSTSHNFDEKKTNNQLESTTIDDLMNICLDPDDLIGSISIIKDENDQLPQMTITEISEKNLDNLFNTEIPDMINTETYDENLSPNDKEGESKNEAKDDQNEKKSNETIFLSADDSTTDNEDKNKDEEECIQKFDKFNSLLKKVSSLLESDDDKSSDNCLEKPNGDKKESGNENKHDDNKDEDDSDNNNKDEEIIIKKRCKKTKFMDSDDGDNDGEEFEFEIGPHSNSEDNKSDDDDDGKCKKTQLKKPVLISDDDNSNDIYSKLNKKSHTKTKGKKRKRVVISDDSSDEGNEEEDNGEENDDNNNNHDPNSTRKKIRKLFTNNRLRDETRNAEKAERERRKRIEEKQRLYNSITEEVKPDISKIDRVVLDIDDKTKEVLVEVDKAFVKILKPHQADGIKFLFNSTIETVERLKENKHESGCILAHSMGLGKTLQVVAFLHTIMNSQHTKDSIRKVLIVVPLNVVKNWTTEFDKWFNECGFQTNTIRIYEMVLAKIMKERIEFLKNWKEKGGIMIITINLFSQLISGKKFTKKQKIHDMPVLRECLLDPGPDMVIVDEGHLLKNDKTAFNNSVSQIRTLRRIILTGTPLQNNLSEYFIMVDFVKPNLLGSKREFKNRFENPIINGQHIDSTDADVKLMKKRVHVLHRCLQGCIHRCSYRVLVPYLQPKYEYVLSIRLTEIQTNLYRYYLDNLTDKCGKNLLNDHAVLRLIWNHPASLLDHYKRKFEEEEEEEDSLKDFVVDDESSSYDSSEEENKNDKRESSDSDIECIFDNNHQSQRLLRSQGKAPEISSTNDNIDISVNSGNRREWWKQFFETEENIYRIELSSKFIILFSILEECEKVGDKLLIFSQSLTNLDLIEHMLHVKNEETNEKYGDQISYAELVQKTGGVSHRWCHRLDYFRIDGKVRCDDRHSIIDRFNDEDDHRARLMLVSTKAGGLGINLIGANRCIIFDVSWNPSHDLQAIYRIYRYGQKKPVSIYRFISFGTMENKIYDRQITKQSMARRVIDEHQITRHFKQSELAELYTFTESPKEDRPLPDKPKDKLLADIIWKHRDLIISYHEHDSLLENRPEEDLTEEERKAAWAEYEQASDPNAQMNNMNNAFPNTQESLLNSNLSTMIAEYNFNLLQPNINMSLLPSTSSSMGFQQPLPHIPTSFKDLVSRNYYQNFYRYMANQPQPNRQEFQDKSYMQMMPPIHDQINDDKLERYFNEVIYCLRKTSIVPEKYHNCSLEQIGNEFTQMFQTKKGTHEWNLKFLCYITCVYLFFNKSRNALTENLVVRLDKLKNDFIFNNNLKQSAEKLFTIIRQKATNNKTNSFSSSTGNSSSLLYHPPQYHPQSTFRIASHRGPKPSSSSSDPIECIDLDDSD